MSMYVTQHGFQDQIQTQTNHILQPSGESNLTWMKPQKDESKNNRNHPAQIIAYIVINIKKVSHQVAGTQYNYGGNSVGHNACQRHISDKGPGFKSRSYLMFTYWASVPQVGTVTDLPRN